MLQKVSPSGQKIIPSMKLWTYSAKHNCRVKNAIACALYLVKHKMTLSGEILAGPVLLGNHSSSILACLPLG